MLQTEITCIWETGMKMAGHIKGMILKSHKALIITSLWEVRLESLLTNVPRRTGFTRPPPEAVPKTMNSPLKAENLS